MGKTLKHFLVLVAQFPIIVGWWRDIFENQIVLLILTLLYEVLLLTWVILGKDVWEKLKPEVVNTTSEWIKISVLNFFSRFHRDYNQQVIYNHRVFNLGGLLTQGRYSLEVEEIFVDLKIASRDHYKIKANLISFKELPDSQPIWKFLRHIEKKDAFGLVIIGSPGCGKTTLLQHIALTFAAKKHRKYRLRAHIPIFLFLREHIKTIIEQAPPLAELMQIHFSDQTRYPNLQPPPNWFGRQLNAGKCLVLLDGLDEVAENKQRLIVSKWVDQQICSYPHCRFILTSRPQGYREAPLTRAHVVLEVMPFTNKQIEEFIRNWYLATKISSYGGKDDIGVRQDAQKKAQDLLNRIYHHRTLKVLAVNPLLLTMIAMIHNYRGMLPERRVELYAEICDVLLGNWRQAKGISDPLTPKQKRAVLQPLAAYMMSREEFDKRVISTEEAFKVIKPYLSQVGLAENRIPHFLKDLQNDSGLLLEKEIGMWSFAHLSFQEYLCATHWYETGEAAIWKPVQWRSFIVHSWWHETLRLYAAQTDATSLAVACVQLKTVSSLTLAIEIAVESLKMEASIRDRIICLLNQNLESSDKIKRRLFSTVLLNLHFNKYFYPIDDKREIDSKFVTCAEYQLFLDDMQSQGKHYEPKHWKNPHFPKGKARKPIVGISFEEADAFCEWLSQFQEMYYRLPTNEEACFHPLEMTNEETHFLLMETTNEFTPWMQNKKLQNFSSQKESEIRTSLVNLSDLPLPSSLDFFNIQDAICENENKLAEALSKILTLSEQDLKQKITNANEHERYLQREIESHLNQESEIQRQIQLPFTYMKEINQIKNRQDKIFQEISNLSQTIKDLNDVLHDKKDIDEIEERLPRKIKDTYIRGVTRKEQLIEEIRTIEKEEAQLQEESERIHRKLSLLPSKIEESRKRIPELQNKKATIENNRLNLEKEREHLHELIKEYNDKLKVAFKREDKYIKIFSPIISLLFEKNPIFVPTKENRGSKILLICLNLAEVFDIPDIENIRKAIVLGNFTEAQQLLTRNLGNNLADAHQRQVNLLSVAIKTNQGEDYFNWRKTQHKLAMLIGEYAYQGSLMSDNPDLEIQQLALRFYWYYRVIVAREAGDLIAWEGIRLVRDQKEIK